MKRLICLAVAFFALVSVSSAQNFLRRAASGTSDFWSMALVNPGKFNYETYFRTSITNLRSRWGYLSRVRLTRAWTYTTTYTNGSGWFYTRRTTYGVNSFIFVDAWNRPTLDVYGNPIK